MPPTTTNDPDHPTTAPLVIGPVRGFWETRDPGGWVWAALYLPLATALGVNQLNRRIDDLLGDRASVLLIQGLIAAAAAGPLILILRSSTWGNAFWRIDDEGVSFAPPKGRPTFLAWDDVEQLKRTDAIILRGRGVKVSFPSLLPEADRREAARRIQERLKDGFDWTPPPPPRRTLGGFLRFLATESVLLTAFAATTFGPPIIQESGGPQIAWVGSLAFLGWMALLVASFVRRRRQAEARRWISRRPIRPAPIPERNA